MKTVIFPPLILAALTLATTQAHADEPEPAPAPQADPCDPCGVADPCGADDPFDGDPCAPTRDPSDPETPTDPTTPTEPAEPAEPTTTEPTDPTTVTETKPQVVEAVPPPPHIEPRIQRSRRLNGHLFNPTETLRDPFPSTYFGLEFGSGYGRLTAAGMKSDIGSLKQTLSGQLHLYKGLSIATSFGGTSLFDNSSGVGGSVNLGHYFDLRYGFDVSPQFRVAIAFDTNIQSFGLLKNISEKAFGGSAQAAWAANSLFGVHADVGGGYGLDAEAAYLNAGLGAGINLPMVPVSVLGSYRLAGSFQDTATFSHTYGIATHYTGRDNFVLGLEVQGQSADQGGNDIFAVNAIFRMRYYWDAAKEYEPKRRID